MYPNWTNFAGGGDSLLCPALSSNKTSNVTLKSYVSPGLVVMCDDSCSRCRGFESRHRILDGHLSH